MKKKVITKLIAMALAVMTVFGAFTMTASAATWKTGRVPSSGNTGYTTVYLSNRNKNAKIKIHSYTYLVNPNNAKERSTRFHVTMRTTSNKWLWEGDITTGAHGKTMNLGNDNYAYKICLRQNDIPFGSWSLWYANYWGIQCTSNCYV